MESKTWVIAILIFIIIWLIWHFYLRFKKPFLKLDPEPRPLKSNNLVRLYELEWDNLTEGEKLRYISDLYFPATPASTQEQQEHAKDNQFIQSLPQSDEGCEDKYKDCQDWANNDECIINPDFMLYNCAKSCKACRYSNEDKFKLVEIYNKRDPPHCVYRGKPYPDQKMYLEQDYAYAMGFNF